jgi:phosphoribosylanthranilate isomerase
MTDIKICGLKDPSHLRLAASLGVRYAGLVFFPRSPRHLSLEAAASLAAQAPQTLTLTALLVDPDDALLAEVAGKAKPRLLQLHGSETPARVAEIRARTGLPVMKALSISAPEDLSPLPDFAEVADMLLFDAKAPAGSHLPGGNGIVFDWNILRNVRPSKPWMLSGGLTPENVGEALRVLKPDAVDVSSGVEDAPGVKSPDRIRAFVDAVKNFTQTGTQG